MTRFNKQKKATKKRVSKKKVATKPKFKDERLDEVIPLFIEMVTKLLNAKGMMRYRADFVDRVKEIMSPTTTKSDKS